MRVLAIDVEEALREEVQEHYWFLVEHVLVNGGHVARRIEFVEPHVSRIDHVEPVLYCLQGYQHELVARGLQFDHHTVLTLLLTVLDIAIERNLEFGDVAFDQILQGGRLFVACLHHH